jgi:hypothetical protein
MPHLATEIDFEDKKLRKTILKQMTFSPNDYVKDVFWIAPDRHQRVAGSLTKPFGEPRATLGDFECLPLEILWPLCVEYLDLKSVFRFRQLNRRARRVVNSTKEYQMMVTYGVTAYCALLRTNLAVHATLSLFYNIQCDSLCVACGNHGGFLFLPTMERCCYGCGLTSRQFQMHELPFHRSLNLHEDTAFSSQVRHLSLSNRGQNRQSIVTTIVAIGHARTIDERKSKLLMLPVDLDTVDDKRHRFNALTALPHIDGISGKMKPTVCCVGCASLPGNTVDSEWNCFYRRTRTPTPNSYSTFRKEYAGSDYLNHFKECPGASRYWNVTKQSLVPPKVLGQMFIDHVAKLNEMPGCPVLSMNG